MITKKITFSGLNDLITVFDGSKKREYPTGNDFLRAKFVIEDEMTVYAICDNGLWTFAVGLFNEQFPLQNRPLELIDDHEHSIMLEIEVPKSFMIKRVDLDGWM